MRLYDYRASQEISAPFYALIMAAMRQASGSNAAKLQAAWPDVWDEMEQRYRSPGGLLPGEEAMSV